MKTKVFPMLVSNDCGTTWNRMEVDIWGIALIPGGYNHSQLKKTDIVKINNSIFNLSNPSDIIYMFLDYINGNCIEIDKVVQSRNRDNNIYQICG